jgi:citrate lyase synthetase
MLLPGTIVECIISGTYPLTIGKRYTVEKEKNNGTFEGIVVKNDNGKRAKYKTKYFKVIKQQTMDEYLDATDF